MVFPPPWQPMSEEIYENWYDQDMKNSLYGVSVSVDGYTLQPWEAVMCLIRPPIIC